MKTYDHGSDHPLREIADRVWAIAKTLRIDQGQAARDLKSISTELHAIAECLERSAKVQK